MAGTGSNGNGEGGGNGPSTVVLAGIFAVIGIILAVGLAFFAGGFGGTSAGATSSLPPSSSPSGAPSLVAVASPSLEPLPSLPGPGDTIAPTAGPGEPTAAPSAPPAPSPTPNTDPRIVTWDVPKFEDCTGTTAGSITVSWEIRRATGVTISIDGPGIYQAYDKLKDTVTIPFGCDMNDLKDTYTLTTTGGIGPAAQVTKTVTARPPEILRFEIDRPDCGAERFEGINMSYELRGATGAKLEVNGGTYSTYNSKATDDIIQFDCMLGAQTYTLRTTGGYGPADSRDVLVEPVVH